MSPRIASRQIKNKDDVKSFVSKTGVEVESAYCRKCMNIKTPQSFYTATDLWLDANGLLSICKTCCNDMFKRFEQTEQSTERAILRMCRILNIKYDERAIQSMYKGVETRKNSNDGKDIEGIFGLYKLALSSSANTSIKTRRGDTSEDFTFTEPSNPPLVEGIDEISDSEYLKQFWGENFNFTDYVFLERELADWKRTHKCDTKAEESLLKELCYKELEIRKARMEGKSTSGLVKEKQDLMKTASVDPAKTALAGSGRSQDTFSAFIKTIEENEPADYYKDKEMFKDFDNIDWYFRKYVTRPLKNFITQSRDFSVEVDDEENEFEIEEEGENGDFPASV